MKGGARALLSNDQQRAWVRSLALITRRREWGLTGFVSCVTPNRSTTEPRGVRRWEQQDATLSWMDRGVAWKSPASHCRSHSEGRKRGYRHSSKLYWGIGEESLSLWHVIHVLKRMTLAIGSLSYSVSRWGRSRLSHSALGTRWW